MAKYYRVDNDAILDSEIWLEATKDELRVITYIIAKSGVVESTKALAVACDISTPRARSAISLWKEAGVLTETDKPKSEEGEARSEARITYEFPESVARGAIDNEKSREVARTIRDNELKEAIENVAELMDRPNLSTQEIKHVTALRSQLGLSGEYITTLAAFLAQRNVLAPKRLLDEASKLTEKGIDNVELLEKYIEDVMSVSGIEWEIRRLTGIYNRSLTKKEKEYILTWSEKYAYGLDIIGEAYDIMAENIGKVSFAYMNKILTTWHAGGLKTVEEVRAFRDKEALAKRESAPKAKTSPKKKTREEPEYTSFSSDDALMRALKRSYGE